MRAVHAIVSAITIVVTVASASAAGPIRPSRHPAGGRSIRMMASAYCDRGATKSGVRARHGVVAADTRRLPLGTRLQIVAPGQPYAGVYTVLDTGSKIKGRDLDIFMPSCSRARRFGRRPLQVRILETRKDRFFIPTVPQ